MSNITITETAQTHFANLLGQQPEGTNIRIFVVNPGTQNAECGVSYCPPEAIEGTDTEIPYSGFSAFIDELSLPFLEDAEIDPSEVDYVNVHGTSTPLGDVAEVKAIQQVFGEHAYDLNISSTKSMTGHLLGAAGAIEAIACVLSVKNDVVPPTINHFTDDPNLDPKMNFTFNKAQERTVNIALSNTFGFGGHNTTVIVKKYNG